MKCVFGSGLYTRKDILASIQITLKQKNAMYFRINRDTHIANGSH